MKTYSLSKKPFWFISILLIAVLLLAACQPAETQTFEEEPTVELLPTATLEAPAPTATVAATPTTMPTATEEVEIPPTGEDIETGETMINVANDPQYGEILVDGEGMTLYMFTRDEPNVSNCAGQCLEAWPPLVDDGNVVAGSGVDPSLIGSTDLPDGSQIVTYNGMPLYYWQGDVSPGDTNGQGVNDVWYVVSPAGEMIDSPQTSAASDDAVVVNVATDPVLGDILVDGEGMTLYMFTRDEPNVSNCAGQCLDAWPPLVADGTPQAGEGVDPSLFGTADLPDGSQIVTYNEMPLYYWAGDTTPGQTTGQGVNNVWYVVSPDGEPIGMDN